MNREMTPFTITTNNTRYLGVTLTKQVKDLFDKNFKSLKKEIEDLIRWQDITSSCFGKANIVKKKKIDIFYKELIILKAIPIKIPIQFLIDKESTISNFI